MSSFKQIAAHRRNALKSAGPITPKGKQHSRCNAVRHGLTAETIIFIGSVATRYDKFAANHLAFVQLA